MKNMWPIFLVLIGCYYDDSCPRDTQLKALSFQIANEQKLLKALTSSPFPWSDELHEQIEEEEDNLTGLLIEKAILEISPCK